MAIFRSLAKSASMASIKTRYTFGDTIRVFVGHERQEFRINKTQLCTASPYFQEKLKYMDADSVMYLPRDSPAMFELFAAWIHEPHTFRRHLDDAISAACDASSPPAGQHPAPDSNSNKNGDKSEAATAATTATNPCQRLHWALVRLHLFASTLSLSPLQDAAMDAIQDLYLRRDWDVTPRFVSFLYSQCTADSSLRLRRWAVAMVAYSLSNPAASRATSAPSQFQRLLGLHPEFSAEYAGHLRKMGASGLDIGAKNPQLRIPANRLRNEERRFAFRQCAFHTHRASAGEGRCPHEVVAEKRKRMPVWGVESVIREDRPWARGVEVPRPLKVRVAGRV
ncbi:uncharacterized protein DNG_00304 [Cephalotrichum gorgonifer]|uniref:BTB domain-containing protein n=1 Tax=Cephalotrichum gorgonifer TaxID=2041049 RepID=A0AAE8SQP3_9PEZI|nr:uncharacterized protein DNG_00304 [Cephalotrichum gorgonifer]